MSSNGIIQNKIVMTRKCHSCEWCPEPIGKGTLAFYRVYRWEGAFMTGYVHPECANAIKESPTTMSDGFYLHEQERGVPVLP